MKQNILVIGEHSYIGNSFRDYLKEKEPKVQVTLAGARNRAWENMDFQAYDAILHAAAIVHTKETPDMQALYHEVNTVFPVRLAKRAKAEGVKTFLFLSTMSVYGKQPSPIGLDTPEDPITLYGKSKLEAEKKLLALADEDFQVGILRPPMVYGPACPGNYPRLAKLARKLFIFPRVKNQRSMIYIENLCECIRGMLADDTETYRIVCPQNAEYVDTTELVKQIRRAHGKGTLVVPFPGRLLRLCAAKNGTAEKVFGDCYYQKSGREREYQAADFTASVFRTEAAEDK